MNRATNQRGFALVVTLVMMALIVTVVVGYLANTGSSRSTSASYANRLRAKMTADNALAAATGLLHQHTKNGNYITAMPAPVPTPSSLRTEIYRPSDSSPDDFLKVTNAVGDVLASRADTGALAAPTPQVDPRPTVTPIPAPPHNGALAIADPEFQQEILPPTGTSPAPVGNSYDFNQVVRVGSTEAGRLVNSTSPLPAALGQWVRVRNAAGELIGRYAFFIEDESMKVNINHVGNKLGNADSTLRVNDLASPAPVATPATQVEEIDPASLLPSPAPRGSPTKALVELGPAGSRLHTKGTLALVPEWNGTTAGLHKFSDIAHMLTSLSKDDITTARGWQRLDINKVVADAAGTDNSKKVDAATKIANWIKDAWTGPAPFGDLLPYQVYGDDRLRLQLAANIVDYIDGDNIPTDMGVFPPEDPNGIPVIGIEKIPYLVEVTATYKSTVTNSGTPGVTDSGAATVTTKLRLNFQNLFDEDLRIEDFIRFIKIKGLPAVVKEGKTVIDHTTETVEIPVGSATSTSTVAPISGIVPVGPDNSPDGVAGVKTFITDVVFTDSFSFTPSDRLSNSNSVLSTFKSGVMEINVFGKDDTEPELFDSTRVALSERYAKLDNSNSNPKWTHDFLENSGEASSINAHYELLASGTPYGFGDPRYRPSNIAKRWYTVTRTDTPRLASTLDKADMDPRAYSVDWYDYKGNRPLLFHRNGPMLNIGELGNVSASEYPWRTVYLQYGGRLHNTREANIIPFVQDRRGSSTAAQSNPDLLPQDYVLLDLFTTSQDKTRSGSININTQANIKAISNATDPPTTTINQGAGAALIYGVPQDKATLGVGNAAGAVDKLASALANRRIAIAPDINGVPNEEGLPPIDNNPRRPYFTIGEVASDITRLNSQNINDPQQSVGGRTHTRVVYSILRANPRSVTSYDRNYGSDMQVEGPFRKISNSITTRGNVFRVLYVGQAIKDLRRGSVAPNGIVDAREEIVAEYLGEAFVERVPVFTGQTVGASSVMKTTDSEFKIISQRAISE